MARLRSLCHVTTSSFSLFCRNLRTSSTFRATWYSPAHTVTRLMVSFQHRNTARCLIAGLSEKACDAKARDAKARTQEPPRIISEQAGNVWPLSKRFSLVKNQPPPPRCAPSYNRQRQPQQLWQTTGVWQSSRAQTDPVLRP